MHQHYSTVSLYYKIDLEFYIKLNYGQLNLNTIPAGVEMHYNIDIIVREMRDDKQFGSLFSAGFTRTRAHSTHHTHRSASHSFSPRTKVFCCLDTNTNTHTTYTYTPYRFIISLSLIGVMHGKMNFTIIILIG